jgi:Tfp pilus assembly protein PilF
MKLNYYEVLGVERSATDQDIRERFRRLARENHPDRYRGDDKAEAERKFQTLTEAVNVLTNPVKRKQHDSELTGGVNKAADLVAVSKAYLAKGVKAYKDGDMSAAYENFDMAVKHNPQDAKAFHYLALSAARIPAYARQAVQAIESALQREPMNVLFLKDAGMICRRAGLVAKAERYLSEALEWDAGNVEAQAALAELRQRGEAAKDAGKGFSLFRKS